MLTRSASPVYLTADEALALLDMCLQGSVDGDRDKKAAVDKLARLVCTNMLSARLPGRESYRGRVFSGRRPARPMPVRRSR